MQEHHQTLTAAQALKILKEGNQRYVAEKFSRKHLDKQRRADIAPHQYPFAAVLGCSDSRVPPEIVFDQGLGDIFIARSAGHVLDSSIIGSLEYAVTNLNVPVIVVLGHYSCGAVAAAASEREDFPGCIAHLTANIKPAVQEAKKKDGDLLKNAVICNTNLTIQQLSKRSSVLDTAIKHNKLQIKGAVYDVNTGEVIFL